MVSGHDTGKPPSQGQQQSHPLVEWGLRKVRLTPGSSKDRGKDIQDGVCGMGDMLPEFWAGPKDDDEQEGKQDNSKENWSRKVMDIFTRLQCYSTYVSD